MFRCSGQRLLRVLDGRTRSARLRRLPKNFHASCRRVVFVVKTLAALNPTPVQPLKRKRPTRRKDASKKCWIHTSRRYIQTPSALKSALANHPRQTIMTLTEYIRQKNPQANPIIELQPTEYSCEMTIGNRSYYRIPLLAERFGITQLYIRIGDDRRLYTAHPDTGTLRPSVFYLS